MTFFGQYPTLHPPPPPPSSTLHPLPLSPQIRVVNAFRSGLETGSLIHLSQLPQFPSTPNLRAARYNPTTVIGKETEV